MLSKFVSFWLFTFVFLAPFAAYGAFSLSQTQGYAGTGSESSHAHPFDSNVSSGDLVVVAGAVWDTVAPTSVTVTSTRVPSYTCFYSVDIGTTIGSFICYGVATSSGSETITVDPEGDGFISFGMTAWTGQHATPLDANGGVSVDLTGTSNTPQDSITTVAANALIIGVVAHNSSTVITPIVDYTQIFKSDDTGSTQNMSMVYRIVTTATGYAVDWSLSSAASWAARTASFAPATVAAGVARRRIINTQ